MTHHGRSADEDLRIAAHEAGHAIVGWLNGRSIKHVTIEPEVSEDGRVLNGYVRFGPPLDDDWQSDIFAGIVENVAGVAAERLHCFTPKALKCGDKRRAYSRAGALVENDQATELLIAAAELEAEHMLREHYPLLVAMASELLFCRTMNGQTALEFMNRCSCAMSGPSQANALSAQESDAGAARLAVLTAFSPGGSR